jgi:hypothetical protein
MYKDKKGENGIIVVGEDEGNRFLFFLFLTCSLAAERKEKWFSRLCRELLNGDGERGRGKNPKLEPIYIESGNPARINSLLRVIWHVFKMKFL